jgi:hypothetical protein
MLLVQSEQLINGAEELSEMKRTDTETAEVRGGITAAVPTASTEHCPLHETGQKENGKFNKFRHRHCS